MTGHTTSELERLGTAAKRLRDNAEHLRLIGAPQLSELGSAVFAAARGVVEAYGIY